MQFQEFRLSIISRTDPQYYNDIIDFIKNDFPEIEPFAYLSALENPKNMKFDHLKTIKDHLIFYVAQSGVSPSHGRNVYNWVINNQLDKLTVKKRGEINNVLNYANYDKINTIEDVDNIKIKGVGNGAKGFVKQFYFNERNICLWTERRFQKGLSFVLENASKNKNQSETVECFKKLKQKDYETISNKWKHKYIGYMLCLQVGLYCK